MEQHDNPQGDVECLRNASATRGTMQSSLDGLCKADAARVLKGTHLCMQLHNRGL